MCSHCNHSLIKLDSSYRAIWAITSSIQPIWSYTNDLTNECNIDITTSPQMPQWEHKNAKFDTDYTDSKKSETTNILVIEAREYLNKQKLSKSFFLITDDSILDLLDSGAGFVHLTVQSLLLWTRFFHTHIGMQC